MILLLYTIHNAVNLWLGTIRLILIVGIKVNYAEEVINNVITLKRGKTAYIDGITGRKWCGSVTVCLCDLNKNYIYP